MLASTKRGVLHLLKIDFIRFCIVGGLGFVINLALLVLLKSVFGLNVFASQALAAEVALLCNFMLHHHWTYKQHHVKKTMRTLLLQFHATSWPAIAGSAALVGLGETILHLGNLAALCVSSIIALGWNFGWSKYVIWRDTTIRDMKEIV
jgi:putative flippase GtrA